MAKRTKGVTARKAKAGSKAPKKSKAAKKKAASRPVRAKPKQQKAKAGQKRSGAKKSRRPRSAIPPSPVQTETTILDVVEEPVPGVVVVTEFVETHVNEPATTRPLVNQTAEPESEAEQH